MNKGLPMEIRCKGFKNDVSSQVHWLGAFQGHERVGSRWDVQQPHRASCPKPRMKKKLDHKGDLQAGKGSQVINFWWLPLVHGSFSES